MSSIPLISVIIPVYNAEKYLSECLDSILGQSYKNLEIIAINDGSTDASLNILNEYAAKDDRITLISKKNEGVSSARNIGLNKASGKYIAFIDSDDYIKKDCFDIVVKAFDDDIDVVSFLYAQIDQNGKISINSCNLLGKQAFFKGIIFKQPWNVWCKVFRLSTIKKYKMSFLENSLYEDLDFISRFYFISKPVTMYLNDCLYFYRKNASSIMEKTRNKKAGMSIQHIFILDNIYTFLNKHSKLEENKEDFMKLCIYCFKSAITYSSAEEKAKCYAEMTSRLISYGLDYKNYPLLECISQGNYSIKLNSDVLISNLRGLEKIFCIKKELGYNVLRIFGKCIYKF